MAGFRRFVPFAFLLFAALLSVLVPHGQAQAESLTAAAPEATLPLPEADACEVGPGATESVSTTETSAPMLSCSVETILSVWNQIDTDCDGTGYAYFTCNEDGSLRMLLLICLPY